MAVNHGGDSDRSSRLTSDDGGSARHFFSFLLGG